MNNNNIAYLAIAIALGTSLFFVAPTSSSTTMAQVVPSALNQTGNQTTNETSNVNSSQQSENNTNITTENVQAAQQQQNGTSGNQTGNASAGIQQQTTISIEGTDGEQKDYLCNIEEAAEEGVSLDCIPAIEITGVDGSNGDENNGE